MSDATFGLSYEARCCAAAAHGLDPRYRYLPRRRKMASLPYIPETAAASTSELPRARAIRDIRARSSRAFAARGPALEKSAESALGRVYTYICDLSPPRARGSLSCVCARLHILCPRTFTRSRIAGYFEPCPLPHMHSSCDCRVSEESGTTFESSRDSSTV